MSARNCGWKNFDGRIGDTDLAADLTASYAGERPKIAGTLRSEVLDADDLGGLVGTTPSIGPGETASPGEKAEAKQRSTKDTVLPDEPIDPARWRTVDFDLDLHADEVRAGKIPLDGFTGKLTVDDGLLRLHRLDLRVGEGHITGRIEADGRQAPVRSNVELDMQRLSVARLLNRLNVEVGALGTISGRARGGVGLGGQGFSIKDMLARSNGEAQLLMEGGEIDGPSSRDWASICSSCSARSSAPPRRRSSCAALWSTSRSATASSGPIRSWSTPPLPTLAAVARST